MLRVALLDRRQFRRGAVGRSVVDEDQLVAERHRAERGRELLVQGADVLHLVEHGDQDRQLERTRRLVDRTWLG